MRLRIPDRAHCHAIVELYADEIAEVLPVDRAAAMTANQLADVALAAFRRSH